MTYTEGPWFDTAINDGLLNNLVGNIVRNVAQQGYANVMAELDAHILNPTPYYETQIQWYATGDRRAVIDDAGIIYGPWLEGTGSRNSPETRFPGYHSFRTATQHTEEDARYMIESELRHYYVEINGI